MSNGNEAIVLFGKYVHEKDKNMPSNPFELPCAHIKIKLVKVSKVYKNGKHEILLRFPEYLPLSKIREFLDALDCYKLNGKYVDGKFYLSFDCSQSWCWDGFDSLLACCLAWVL